MTSEKQCYNGRMKLERTYDFTCDDFYDYLEEHLLADITKATGREVKASDLQKGFRFARINEQDKSLAPVYITIDEYQRGKIYRAIAKSANETAVTSYTTDEPEPGKIHIIFEDTISDYERKKDSMSPMSRKYHEFTYLARMSRTLGNMGSEIARIKADLPKPKSAFGNNAMKQMSEKAQKKLIDKANQKAEENEKKNS